MTLSVARPRVLFVGNGSASTVSLSDSGQPIAYAAKADFVVKELIVATGVISTKTLGVDYDLDLTSVSPGAVTPGILTRTAGALASGRIWSVYRSTALEQDIDIGGDFSASDIEQGLDDIMVLVQEVDDAADRAIRLSVFEDLSAVSAELPGVLAGNAGKVIGVNADEDGLEFADLSGVTFEIGTTTTLVAGSSATAAINDEGEGVFSLDLGIPRGNTGASGDGTGDMLAANNLSDVANAATAFGLIKQAASTSATGVVELATDAEAAGGATNDTTRYITTDHLNKARADVASATTTDLGAVASNYARITGTTTITGLGTAAAGVWRDVVFGGILTLTHNATSLIIPGGANITTAAGDAMRVRSEGSGNWRVLNFIRASALPLVMATTAEAATGTSTTKPVAPAGLFPAQADVASDTTTNIGAATSTFIRITGTTAITAFDTVAAGIRRVCRMEDALTLTHNATNLIIPGAANITTATNDRFEAMSLGSGNWLVLWYQKASGAAVSNTSSGKLVTRAYGEYLTSTDTTSQIPLDDTIPQNTEGTQVISVSIILTSTSNRVRITVSGFGVPASGFLVCALFKDSDANAIDAWIIHAYVTPDEFTTVPHPCNIAHTFEYAPSAVGAVAFKLRVGDAGASASWRLNSGDGGARAFGGVARTCMVVEEIAP